MQRQHEQTVDSVLNPQTTDETSRLADHHLPLHSRRRLVPVEADPVAGLEGLRRAEKRR
jgi:hypothetical protein